jgi:hypothetical protein
MVGLYGLKNRKKGEILIFDLGKGDICQAAVALWKVIGCVRAQDSVDRRLVISTGVRNGCESIVFLLMADLWREPV